MYKVENILNANQVKTQSINTPKGVLIMADNEDGTFQPFPIDVDLKKVTEFEQALLTDFRNNHKDLMNKINDNLVLDDETEKALIKMIESFKKTGTW